MFSPTLAYFSLFSRPLTKREFSTAVYCQEHEQTLTTTNHLLIQKPVALKSYHERTVHTDQRMRTATKAARIIRHVPFVRAIFLCNTVAMNAATAASDVDLFIVTEKGRLWFSRLMVTVVTALTGMRRSKARVANKVCLSFYVSSDGLDLSDIKIDNDIYLAYWLHTLRPLYDPNHIQKSLYAENNWAKRVIPNGLSVHTASPRIAAPKSSEHLKRFFEVLWSPMGKQLELQAKAIQQTKMKLNTMTALHEPNTNVVVTDTMLKFHENDRRAFYRDKWQSLCKQYAT